MSLEVTSERLPLCTLPAQSVSVHLAKKKGLQWATELPLQPPVVTHPKGPKIEKIQDRPPGLNFSSEIENFKRATCQTLIFVGNSEGQD